MATPGWYPDPAGRPGAFRYWDGDRWAADTSTDPYADPTIRRPGAFGDPSAPPPAYESVASEPTYPPPGTPSPPAPGGPGGPGAPQGPGGSGGSGRTVAIVLGAVLAVLLLAVATYLVVRTLVDDDGDAAGEDTSSQSGEPTGDPGSEDPTDPASPDPTFSGGPGEEEPSAEPSLDPFADDRQPTARTCSGGSPRLGSTPVVDGRQQGGGLSVPVPQGFDTSDSGDQARLFTFATGVSAPSKEVRPGWAAVQALGTLPRVNGFTSASQAAADVMECLTTIPSFYEGFSGAAVTASRAVDVDGRPAWQIDAEIRVEDPEVDVLGDFVKVIVVDTGDPDGFGVFVSTATIGEQDLITEQGELARQLTVD